MSSSTLALPDFVGFIFRKSKLSQNKIQSGGKSIEKSEVTINSFQSLLDITNAKLFHFINVKDEIIEKSLLNL